MVARLHGGQRIVHSLAIDPLVRRQDGEPLDHVLQLAHIAGSDVLFERRFEDADAVLIGPRKRASHRAE